VAEYKDTQIMTIPLQLKEFYGQNWLHEAERTMLAGHNSHFEGSEFQPHISWLKAIPPGNF
jgi:hypothetical protein